MKHVAGVRADHDFRVLHIGFGCSSLSDGFALPAKLPGGLQFVHELRIVWVTKPIPASEFSIVWTADGCWGCKD